MIYDEISGYTITGINPFRDATMERDHVFVDEFSCIGKSPTVSLCVLSDCI